MKTELRLIGEFQELGYSRDPNAPRLADVRGKRRLGNKAAVVRYLRGGRPFIYSPGLDTDVFDPTKTSDTPSVFTDGAYAWRELIAYYVDRYDIELPLAFEIHMEGNGWKNPGSIDISQLTLPARTAL